MAIAVEAFFKLPPARRAAPVVLLTGDEPFFKDEVLAAVQEAVAGGPGAPVERIERRAGGGGGRGAPEIAPVLDELRTGSLFSPAKVVYVRDAEAFLAAAAEPIVAFAGRGAPSRTALVLDVGAFDKRTKAAKELDRAALVVECKRLYSEPPPWARGGPAWDTPLVHWTVARARAAGLAARPEVAWHLTQITGNDLHEIAATLEKIRLSGASDLAPAHVEALAGRTRRDDAFAVADALGRRDAARALEVLSRVFERGLEDRRGGRVMDEGAIGLIVFARLHARLHEIRRTAGYLAAGGARSRDAAAQALGIAPFLVERALGDAERFRGTDFGSIWRALLDADLGLKGALPAGGARAAVERLILTILQPVAATAIIPASSR